MKHLLLVVIALAASAALADIESFCGIKFGEEIGRRNKVHAGTGRLTGFKTLEKPFRSFNGSASFTQRQSTPKSLATSVTDMDSRNLSGRANAFVMRASGWGRNENDSYQDFPHVRHVSMCTSSS